MKMASRCRTLSWQKSFNAFESKKRLLCVILLLFIQAIAFIQAQEALVKLSLACAFNSIMHVFNLLISPVHLYAF